MFLEQAEENRLIFLDNKREIMQRLLACLVKPLVSSDWWDKTLSVVERVINEVPCYIARSDKSEKIVELIEQL